MSRIPIKSVKQLANDGLTEKFDARIASLTDEQGGQNNG